uniref:Uncharacterized protein n=1 Tax=Octopus bimaculoides TaxID=37653 RepID=A0A0L8GUC8_OCTBM
MRQRNNKPWTCFIDRHMGVPHSPHYIRTHKQLSVLSTFVQTTKCLDKHTHIHKNS